MADEVIDPFEEKPIEVEPKTVEIKPPHEEKTDGSEPENGHDGDATGSAPSVDPLPEDDPGPELRLEDEPPHGQETLPDDIEAIWGVSPESRKFALTLIEAWGVDVFRTSSTHTLALEEAEREAKLTPIRLAFVKAHAKRAKADDTNPNPEDPR